MSTSRWQALARAAVTKTWPVGMCDNFCANMYGFTASGYVDAVAHWNALLAAQRTPGSTAIPAGMLAFWGGGHGHVAISDGTGSVWSTDIGGAGTVSRVPLGQIATQWGKPYLGWGEPVFQNVAWSDAMIHGYDVAGYQPVNFPTSGIDFAIIKITEGTGFINSSWTGQRSTARNAGLVTGFYHFARPGSMSAQADFFLSQITLQPGDVLAFDWEDTGVSSANKDAWIKYVQQKTGHKVLLYCNRDFWQNRDTSGFAGDGLWIADPTTAGQPAISSPWLMHQYSTANNIDHDVAQFSDRAEMAAWAGGDDVALSADDKTWLNSQINAAVNSTVSKLINYPLVSPTDPNNGTRTLGTYIRYGDSHYANLLDAVAAAAASGDVAPVLAQLADLSVKLAALQSAVTDPAGLLDQIRAELDSFQLVLQQKTPGA